MYVQEHQLRAGSSIGVTLAEDVERRVNSLLIGTEHSHVHHDDVALLDLAQVVECISTV